MMLGSVGNPDHDDCTRIIHAALDHGINFVDTADMYSDGESEEIVGAALKGRRDAVVLATKVHFPMGDGPNRSGNSRRWIVAEVEESLRRLQTDWIDLYQIHRPDPSTDIEETLWALTDLVQAGKIRAFGCSTFPVEEIVEAYHVARQHGLMRFRTEQPPYSMLARGIEAVAVAFAAAHPAVSSVIIGPRTRQQLTDLLAGAALVLDDRTLDRIDEIVPPWTDAYDPTEAFKPAALADVTLRRRPLASRSAA
jgi:aryl-alcohol dehydrogenase-like predicted oxidoreductase